ncbi:MAG: M48 family metalloprotease [Pseudomonadota bacterium]
MHEFTEQEECAIGQEIATKLLSAHPAVSDLAVQRKIMRIGQLIASHSERAQLDWKFTVLDDTAIYMLAAPGGLVFISNGLLSKVRAEDELAGILAHGIAHVLKKHQLAIINMKVRAILGDKMMEQLAAKSNPQMAGAMQMATAQARAMQMRQMEMENELDADHVAIDLIARAGYKATGLPALLQSLIRADTDGSATQASKALQTQLVAAPAVPNDTTLPIEMLENQAVLAQRIHALTLDSKTPE